MIYTKVCETKVISYKEKRKYEVQTQENTMQQIM